MIDKDQCKILVSHRTLSISDMALPIRIKLYRSYRTLPSCQACISEIDKVQCKPKILYQSSLITISLTALSNFIDPHKVLLNFIWRMMSVAGLCASFFEVWDKTFYFLLFFGNCAPDCLFKYEIAQHHTIFGKIMPQTTLCL